MLLSVIICSHNPKHEFLNRTLQALKEQSLHDQSWELLLIDNASNQPVSESFSLVWHPSGKIIREAKIGLTQARIRGIAEARGDIIVFVDDDNCLKQNYLELLVSTMDSIPLLGTLGAGKILPEFEQEPTHTELPFLRSLALRDEKRAHFSNDVNYHKALPFGAGLCIRRSIGLAYVSTCAERPIAASLGRTGSLLLSAEDIDLALHACRDGYLAGVLPELELIHLIPKARLEHNYLTNLAAGHAASNYLLSKIWKFEVYPENAFVKWGRYWKNRIQAKGLGKKILIAEYRAEKEARKTWKKLMLQTN